jgi:ABC-type methionine transport system ATPase subunit
MEEETQTKPKLSRVELLAKARQAKAEKARLKKEQQGTAEYEFVGPETQNPVVVDAKKEKNRALNIFSPSKIKYSKKMPASETIQ